jgi:hypothetical protein
MWHTRKVTIVWDEEIQRFEIRYVNAYGVECAQRITRDHLKDESIDSFLQRVGQTCIATAKGI